MEQEPRQARLREDQGPAMSGRRGPFYAPGLGGSQAESGTGAEVRAGGASGDYHGTRR